MSTRVMVLMGSANDWDVMREVGVELDKLGIAWQAHVASAHRSLSRTVDLVRQAETDGVKVFVCGAGMAAHLAGVVAATSTRPVIGVPLAGGLADGLDALLATVQMPAGIPVATVAVGKAGARNAAVLAAQMLSLADEDLATRLAAARASQSRAVADADAALPRGGGWA
jgi:5-(carboxyamino)imidazole ribonucleotide mutase